MKKRITVIMPAYNSDKSVYNAISSVRSQTYDLLEMIMVDDGSNDFTPEICDEQTLNDDRCIAIHHYNEGVEEARYKGIGLISGEYVTFIDSDDCNYHKMYQIMINCLEEHNADVVICDFSRNDFNENELDHFNYKPFEINRNDYFKLYMNGSIEQSNRLEHVHTVLLHNKIIKTDIFLSAIPKLPSEDSEMNVHIANEANKIMCVDLPLDFYHNTDESLSKVISHWHIREYVRFFRIENYIFENAKDLVPTLSGYLFEKTIQYRYKLKKANLLRRTHEEAKCADKKAMIQHYFTYSGHSMIRKSYRLMQYVFPDMYSIALYRNKRNTNTN